MSTTCHRKSQRNEYMHTTCTSTTTIHLCMCSEDYLTWLHALDSSVWSSSLLLRSSRTVQEVWAEFEDVGVCMC